MVFENRIEAGRRLARTLGQYRSEDTVVFALPRGGVVVGAEVAKYLSAHLDILVACKIPHPLSSELAIGAVTERGAPVWQQGSIDISGDVWREEQTSHARAEAKRRRVKYQGGQPLAIRGRTAIVVDDGAATGFTMVAALRDLVSRRPGRIIVALPVAPPEAVAMFHSYADAVHTLYVPEVPFMAIGAYYDDFAQVSDEEVRGLLGTYRNSATSGPLDLPALNSVLATIGRFPVTNTEVASQARRLHAPRNVVQFFESMPGSVEFKSKADVMRRSGESELIMEEERQQEQNTPSATDTSVDVSIRAVAGQPSAAIKYSVEPSEIGQQMPGVFHEIAEYLEKSGVWPSGPPYTMYLDPQARQNESWRIISGFPVDASIKKGGRVVPYELPGADTVAAAVHTGPYTTIDQTYAQMQDWADKHGLRPMGPIWEQYLTNPDSEPDPSKWRTAIYMPVLPDD